MNRIVKRVNEFSRQAREKRADIFRNTFCLREDTKILDLGSESGSNVNALLKGTPVQNKNVYIADIEPETVYKGSKEYGFNPVVISESEALPFDDDFFDIVYCSSVIEHVTIPKEKVWDLNSDRQFRTESLARQKEFANEIRRLGKQYFVQTPYKYFPIESHSWLPFVAWFPRRFLIPVLRFTNHFWIKKTSPDWNLLNKSEMRELFYDADIIDEKKLGLTKSLMAIRATIDSTPVGR